MTERKKPTSEPRSVAAQATDCDEKYDTEPMPGDPTVMDPSGDPTIVDRHPPVSNDGASGASQAEVDAIVAGLVARYGDRLQQDEEPPVEGLDEAKAEWLSRALIALAQKASHPGMVRRYGPHSDGGDSVAYAGMSAPASKAAFSPDPSRKVLIAKVPEGPGRSALTVALRRPRRRPFGHAARAALVSLLAVAAAAGAWAWWRGGADKGGAGAPAASARSESAAAPLAAPWVSATLAEPPAAGVDSTSIATAQASTVVTPATPLSPVPAQDASRPRSTRPGPQGLVRSSAEGSKPAASAGSLKAVDFSDYMEER